MAKTKKLQKEELEKLQSLVNSFNNLQVELGRFEIEKHQILHQVSITQGELQKFQDELKGKYGDVSVDINNGEIKPNESNKKD